MMMPLRNGCHLTTHYRRLLYLYTRGASPPRGSSSCLTMRPHHATTRLLISLLPHRPWSVSDSRSSSVSFCRKAWTARSASSARRLCARRPLGRHVCSAATRVGSRVEQQSAGMLPATQCACARERERARACVRAASKGCARTLRDLSSQRRRRIHHHQREVCSVHCVPHLTSDDRHDRTAGAGRINEFDLRS